MPFWILENKQDYYGKTTGLGSIGPMSQISVYHTPVLHGITRMKKKQLDKYLSHSHSVSFVVTSPPNFFC